MKEIKNNLPYMIILFLCLLFSDCADKPTQPPISNADTTSHNFSVVRVDTLGTIFSFANGVDVVNENDIWVAGIFTERDTNNEILYNNNLAHWNGKQWSLQSVRMMGYNNTGPLPTTLGAVKHFIDTSIFVVAKHDNSTAWWNGNNWKSTYVTNAVVSPKLWARSKNEIYFVAQEGKATFYDGQKYENINTGLINPPLLDVWGDESHVYAVGSPENLSQHGDQSVMLYSINTTTMKVFNRYNIINDTGKLNYRGYLNSIFRANKYSKLWLFSGEGHGLLNEIRSIEPLSCIPKFSIPNTFYPKYIRGNADNDLFLFGATGGIWHFNGGTWKFFETSSNFLLEDCMVKGNTVILVGESRGEIVSRSMVIMLQRK